jgi:hypothetical protein
VAKGLSEVPGSVSFPAGETWNTTWADSEKAAVTMTTRQLMNGLIRISFLVELIEFMPTLEVSSRRVKQVNTKAQGHQLNDNSDKGKGPRLSQRFSLAFGPTHHTINGSWIFNSGFAWHKQ